MRSGGKKLVSLAAAVLVGSAFALGASGAGAGKSFIKSGEMPNVTREETGAVLNENFYSYINFEKLKSDVIPYGRSQLMHDDWANDVLIGKIREIAENRGSYPRGSNEQKLADFIEQVYDEEARESVGTAPLEGILSKIENAASADELAAVVTELQWGYGVPTLFKLRIMAGIYDSSKYSAVYQQMNMPVEAESFFKEYGTADNLQKAVRNIIEARGGSDPNERARKCVDLLIEIAENSIPDSELFYRMNDFREITIDEFSASFSADISPFTDRLKAQGCDKITVCDTKQLEAIARLFNNENLAAWKDYMLTETLVHFTEQLPEKTMRLLSPLGSFYKLPDEEALAGFFTNEMAYMFSSEYADPALIEDAKDFTKQIISAYAEMIKNSADIDAPTKERFIKKLENMSVNIAVPDAPYDGGYDCVPASEGGNFLQNIINRSAGEFKREVSLLGKPFNKTEYDWSGMPPQVYGNAQYKTANYVIIPYATLAPPYFEKGRDLYENLGNLGFIIGHEISHGFDSTCMVFNENGDYDPDWIGEEYGKTLEKKKADITALYNSKKLFGIYPLDGEKTLGENMADIASVQCMLSMAKTDGQRKTFFESYAESWYMLIYDSGAYDLLYNDEHSLYEFRTNVVISQMDEFYDVYGITDGAMYTPPESRRRVW